MSDPKLKIKRFGKIAGASVGMLVAIFFSHLVIKLPTEPTWAPIGQIWENFTIAASFLLNAFKYPLLSAFAVLLVALLFGGWIGGLVGRLIGALVFQSPSK